jgi:hypothetical protein
MRKAKTSKRALPRQILVVELRGTFLKCGIDKAANWFGDYEDSSLID